MTDSPPPKTDVLPPGSHQPVQLKLVVVSGPDFGREVLLSQGTCRIGTDPANELVLTDSAVSRTHLVAEVLTSGIRITDNQSTNGSFCDGMRFTNLEPQLGAVIRVGRTEIKLMPAEARADSLAPSTQTRLGGLVGGSLPMRKLFAIIERVAPSDADILIQGETGTGKEVCAEAIHAHSSRKAGPFVVCDLGAQSANLIESELFGHVRGAFTGAAGERAGVFEQAHGGTLFLDEIGELPLELQPRLLRAIERRQVKRVGGNGFKTVDVRVIAASHKDLQAEIAQKHFREDLYHRLAVVKIHLPPLRDRKDDLPVLVDHVLDMLGKPPGALSAETRALLMGHDWPGNVRELRNVVERAVSLGADAALPEGARSAGGTRSASADRPFKEAKEDLVNAFERDYLVDLLNRAKGNISLAARTGGIDRVYLHRLLKKHQLDAK